jgi:hypothetical protein
MVSWAAMSRNYQGLGCGPMLGTCRPAPLTVKRALGVIAMRAAVL